MSNIGPFQAVRRSRPWRLAMTALGFAVFGVGGVVMSLTLFPALALAPVSAARRQSAARRSIARLFRAFVALLRALGVVEFDDDDVAGLDTPNQLIVANHPSLLDVVFLIGLSGEANCVVKAGHWRNPFTALAVRTAHYLRNDTPDLVDRCVAVLQRGESLIVFPEGTRSRPGEPLRLQRGAAEIALCAGFGLTPVVIHCNPPLLAKTQKWHQVPARPARFAFQVMPVIPVSDTAITAGEQAARSRRDLTRQLARLFERELSA